MRRIIALFATAALALTLGPLTAAQASHEAGPAHVTIEWVEPDAGATLDGVVSVEFRFAENSALRDVSAWEIAVEGQGTLCRQTYPEPPLGWSNNPQTVSLQWDTTKQVSGDGQTGCNASTVVPSGSDLGANGSYTLKVTVTTVGAGDELPGNTSTRTVTVTNDASAPTGVKLKYDEKNDTITVSWAKPPEPDVRSYLLAECIVERSSKPCKAKDWTTFPDPIADKLSASIETAGPGIYRYRVAAIRSGEPSDWALPQSDPTEIEVEEEPEPSTTTTEPQVEDAGDDEDEPEVVTRTVVQPTRRVQRAAPQVLQRVETNEDRPYSDTLPYEEADSEALGELVGEDGDGDTRAVLVPLAGGAFFLMLAGHVWYLNRRTSNSLQVVPVDGDDQGF